MLYSLDHTFLLRKGKLDPWWNRSGSGGLMPVKSWKVCSSISETASQNFPTRRWKSWSLLSKQKYCSLSVWKFRKRGMIEAEDCVKHHAPTTKENWSSSFKTLSTPQRGCWSFYFRIVWKKFGDIFYKTIKTTNGSLWHWKGKLLLLKPKSSY